VCHCPNNKEVRKVSICQHLDCVQKYSYVLLAQLVAAIGGACKLFARL